MNFNGISGLGFNVQTTDKEKAGQNVPGGSAFADLLGKVGQQSPEQEFLDFMKMSPAEKMQYMWLASHGITKEEFDAMSPEEKAKLVKQMEAEMREKIQKGMDSSAASLF
jgi:predicted flavoprotein YhiN